MNIPKDSDDMPFDDSEFSPEERARLRKVLVDEERSSWAWRQLRVLTPVAVAVVVGFWQAIDWMIKHLKFQP